MTKKWKREKSVETEKERDTGSGKVRSFEDKH
jgi:hypothetical protein